jgi:hypothetical protein
MISHSLSVKLLVYAIFQPFLVLLLRYQMGSIPPDKVVTEDFLRLSEMD